MFETEKPKTAKKRHEIERIEREGWECVCERV